MLKSIFVSERPRHRPHLNYVDGLRALAVSAVIVNHYFETILPSGFLGVDIFFVISGFVITLNLRHSSSTSLALFLLNFYSRRIKRLLPALVLCVLLSSLLFALLTTKPPVSMYLTASYALFGFSNIYLYVTSFDYFSLDARLNPFTHTWSLGVEEQFYLIYPALFFALNLPGRSRAVRFGCQFLAALTIGSLAIYVFEFFRDESSAFYLIHARFWELSLGAIAYFGYERRAGGFLIPPIIVVGILVAVLFLPQTSSPWATIACGALTALLLLGLKAPSMARAMLESGVAVYVGRISYSLYLWHWSLLVLSKWTLGESLVLKLIVVALAAASAAASYHWVEAPFRYGVWFKTPSRTVTAGLAAATLAAIVINAGLGKIPSGNNQLIARLAGVNTPDDWPKIPCDVNSGMLAQFDDPYGSCLGGERTPEKPHFVYVIGDSHAAQLMLIMDQALAGTPYTSRFLQSGKRSDYPSAFFRANAQGVPIVDFISQNLRPGDFVVTSFHRGLINPHLDKHIPLGQSPELNLRAVAYIQNMRQWAKLLTAKGVGLVLIYDTPLMRVISPVTACALQLSLTGNSVCHVTREQDLHTRKAQDMVFAAISQDIPGVVSLDAGAAIFGVSAYADVLDDTGNYLMMDWNYVSPKGAEKLLPMFSQFFQSIRSALPTSSRS